MSTSQTYDMRRMETYLDLLKAISIKSRLDKKTSFYIFMIILLKLKL